MFRMLKMRIFFVVVVMLIWMLLVMWMMIRNMMMMNVHVTFINVLNLHDFQEQQV